MDDEGEIIYCKLLDCYQLNRKEVHFRRKTLEICFCFVFRFQCRYVLFSELNS